MKRLIVLGLILAFIVPIGAQESDETVRLDEVVVSATRNERTVLEAPGHATVITAEEIEASGAADLADVLTREAGVIVRDYGAAGAQKSISIRGASSAQVLVLIDGLRQNDSRSGGVNLAGYSLESIERIEIIRGGYGAVYGSDAVGGVVNIVTKQEADDSFKLSIENSSYLPRDAKVVKEGPVVEDVDADLGALVDTQEIGVSLSKSVGAADVVLSGSFVHARNEFVWKDDEYVDDYRKRVNADNLSGGADLSVAAPLAEGRLRLAGGFYQGEVGAPGEIDPSSWSLSDDARQESGRQHASVAYQSDRFLTDLLTFDGTINYRRESLNFSSSDSEHVLHTVGFDLGQEFFAGDTFSLVYGGNLQLDTAESTEIGDKNRTGLAGYLQVPVYLAESFELIPAVRFDYASDFDPALTYRLSALYAPLPDLTFKLSGGSSYRAPTFNDLYWPNDGFSEGNQDLKPERGYFGELGLTYMTHRTLINAYLFTRYVEEEIQWTETSPWFYEPMNIGESFYPGFEIDGEFKLTKGLSLSGSYTLLYSYLLKDSSADYSLQDDLRVAYTPLHNADAALEYSTGPTSAGIGLEYSSAYYSDNANTEEEEGFVVVNLFGRRVITEMLSATFGVDNLFNAVYERKDGYIAAPLTIRIGAQLEM